MERFSLIKRDCRVGCIRLKADYIWQIVLVLIGALASAYAGYWFGNRPEEPAIIEYRESVNKDLRERIGDTEKLEITFDGNKLEQVSRISFGVANTSDSDFGPIELHFEIEDPRITPLFHDVTPPDTYPKDAVSLMSSKDGVYVFELDYLNRSDSIWEGTFNFSFYFGEAPPKIDLKVGSKGISLKEYDLLTPNSIATIFISNVWWLIAIYGIIIYISIRFLRTHDKIKESKFKQSLIFILKKNQSLSDDEKIDKILESSKSSPSFKEVVSKVFSKQ